MGAFFVTGTDTEVGKTFISQTIMHIFQQKRLTSVGYKPVASGCAETEHGLRNDDALALQRVSTVDLAYSEVNPIPFKDAVAPHLAAAKNNQQISLDVITSGFANLLDKNTDLTLVEGAGGWRLPLGQGRFMSEFVKQQQLPVILVVGVRLGCINHACLTVEAILRDGLQLAGWVANHVDAEMPYLHENVLALREHIDAPFLGEVPLVKDYQKAAQYLDVSPLLAG